MKASYTFLFAAVALTATASGAGAASAIPTFHHTLATTSLPGAPPTQFAAPARRIEGVWYEQVTVKSCSTGRTLLVAHALNMFIGGGTLMATNASPPTTKSPSIGTWRYNQPGNYYRAEMRFFRFNPDGVLLGWRDIKRTIELSADGNKLNGTVTYTDYTPMDTVFASGCASESGIRLFKQ